LINLILGYIPQNTPILYQIRYNKSFFFYFKDYIVTINSTKIPIIFLVTEQIVFRDRHNNLIQNVLVVCNFDIKFTNILVSWEGSNSDLIL
jgi:hypothetical protein